MPGVTFFMPLPPKGKPLPLKGIAPTPKGVAICEIRVIIFNLSLRQAQNDILFPKEIINIPWPFQDMPLACPYNHDRIL